MDYYEINVCYLIINDIYLKFFSVFINDIDNDQASKAMDIVQTYLKKNSNYGLSLQIDKIEANKTDAKALLESSMLVRIFQIFGLLEVFFYLIRTYISFSLYKICRQY